MVDIKRELLEALDNPDESAPFEVNCVDPGAAGRIVSYKLVASSGF